MVAIGTVQQPCRGEPVERVRPVTVREKRSLRRTGAQERREGKLAMLKLTSQGQEMIEKLALRHGVSTGAVMTLLQALVHGNGASAQFSHPEWGGSGQWMRGGMTMVGDMFNDALKAKVNSLCSELSAHLADHSLFVPDTATDWWPGSLGAPSASGTQNNIRYAYFPSTRRLAIEIDGQMTIYDTLDHRIGGISQQQSRGASLAFTSQNGVVDLSDLPVISRDGVRETERRTTSASPGVDPSAAGAGVDAIATIERLADLKEKGILTEEEFAAKKAELLGRL
jgi:hypothetical protein